MSRDVLILSDKCVIFFLVNALLESIVVLESRNSEVEDEGEELFSDDQHFVFLPELLQQIRHQSCLIEALTLSSEELSQLHECLATMEHPSDVEHSERDRSGRAVVLIYLEDQVLQRVFCDQTVFAPESEDVKFSGPVNCSDRRCARSLDHAAVQFKSSLRSVSLKQLLEKVSSFEGFKDRESFTLSGNLKQDIPDTGISQVALQDACLFETPLVFDNVRLLLEQCLAHLDDIAVLNSDALLVSLVFPLLFTDGLQELVIQD